MSTSVPTYGVEHFVADARRIMEVAGGSEDREAVVRTLEPLLQRALAGPGWTDARYAAVSADGRPGYRYYHNTDGSLTIYGVLFRPGHPTPAHDHGTWGLIETFAGGSVSSLAPAFNHTLWSALTTGVPVRMTLGAQFSFCPP